MADYWGQVAGDAARLEAALNRLAKLRQPGTGHEAPDPAAAELAGRLDALIAELRAALGKDAAD